MHLLDIEGGERCSDKRRFLGGLIFVVLSDDETPLSWWSKRHLNIDDFVSTKSHSSLVMSRKRTILTDVEGVGGGERCRRRWKFLCPPRV